MKLENNSIIPESVKDAMRKSNIAIPIITDAHIKANAGIIVSSARDNYPAKLSNVATLLGLSESATHIEVVSKIKALKSQKIEAAKKVIQIETDAAYVNGKITLEQKSDFIKLGLIELSATIEILKSLKPLYQSHKSEYEDLLKMSGNELWENGKLEMLRTYSLDQFKTKYKECFGKDFKEN